MGTTKISLEITLINCEINFILTWSDDTKLYVPVATCSSCKKQRENTKI